ncbi:MAG TPA: hypothetical protein VJA26_10045 [Gammaproteobacteria bacterium]|nr:hypothetical protein [Gammaproteobacteria bacterium]
MFHAEPHPLFVAPDGEFRVAQVPTAPTSKSLKSTNWKEKLEIEREAIGGWQHKLYAHGRHAMLLIFQALDAGDS